jgi:sigma-B regulation protein RsbU (phosphoserine phosphatase)
MPAESPEPGDSILIVDDTAANLKLLSQILGEQGYAVRAVASGARALESAAATPPQMVLLDIRMPEMDGFEVCRRLKADPQTREIPVLFISALDDVQDKLRGFSVGGIDYITKPFQVQEVLARVGAHLELRRLERKLQEANRRYAQELSLAGSLQQSFLAHPVPALPGWQMATAFRPARETSGDFYGLFELPARRLGIIVGDVVDKGAAAALFMALSWTLLRTFAFEFPEDPARAVEATNARLLADTDGTRFVTVFLGSLEPGSGRLDFANAGHNPALLFRGSDASEPERLTRTGRMLGMFPEDHWEAGRVQLDVGDTLFLYTDGVTEACAADGVLYGTERMLSTLRTLRGVSAPEILGRVLEGVTAHLHGDPQPDDIALVAIRRERA